MKHALISIGLVLLVASFGFDAGSAETRAPSIGSAGTRAPSIGSAETRAPSNAATTTDDPPPDIRDCPFCGGNPSLHRARFFAMESEIARVTLRLVP